jgi:hypothetical protein
MTNQHDLKRDCLIIEEMIYYDDFIVIPNWLLSIFIKKRINAIISAYLLGKINDDGVDRIRLSDRDLAKSLKISRDTILEFRKSLLSNPIFFVQNGVFVTMTYIVNIEYLKNLREKLNKGCIE